MRAQAADDRIFLSFVDFFLHFFQREVHDVVMMQFFARQDFAEAQPQPMQQMHFVGGQVWRVRPEDFVDLVPVRHVNFQIELRLLVAEFFPGLADLPRLLFGLLLRGMADDDSAGLQRSGGAQNTVPKIVGGDDREPNGFAALLGHRQRLRKQMLLDAAEKLVGFEFVFAGCRSAATSARGERRRRAARV